MPPSHPKNASLEELEAEIERRLGSREPTVTESPQAVPRPVKTLKYAGKARALLGRRLSGSSEAVPVVAYSFPVVPWDSWLVLDHLVKEPLRLNQDNSIPVRWYRPIEGQMARIPDWLGISGDMQARLFTALELLRGLGCIRVHASRSGSTEFQPAPDLPATLAAGWEAFLESCYDTEPLAILDPGLDHLPRSCGQRIGAMQWTVRIDGSLKGIGAELSRRILACLPRRGACRRADLVQAFRPARPFVPEHNGRWEMRHISVSVEDFLDRIGDEDSAGLLGAALLHPALFGLLESGFDAEGHATVGFSPVGRRLFGLEAPVHPVQPRHIHLTPAYDLVFGRPDADALAWCSLFLETSGHDHGIVGKLTAAAIQRALRLGIGSGQILSILESRLAAPIPENVRTTMQGWVARARPVQVQEGIVLTCPDADVASTLERMSKGQANRLSPTHLLLSDRKALTALRKKAVDQGILL
jgi:hypothetical protein